MLTLAAFILAIATLVAVHELGHFALARACGVKVLQFSVGFGPRIAGWVSQKSGTEYSVGLLPLGGFVRMLDEREAPVAPDELALAFNRQPLCFRVAIVAAGPIANLLLAVVLYSIVNWTGVEQPQALLARAPQGSVLANAGFTGAERVVRAGFEGDVPEDVTSFESFRWWLARGVIEHRNLQVEYVAPQVQGTRSVLLPLSGVEGSSADVQLLEKIGILAPFSQARLGYLLPQGAAAQAQLHSGDVVLRVDQIDIVDAAQLRELIRASGRNRSPAEQIWLVERKGSRQSILVIPKREPDGAHFIGRIGAAIGAPPVLSMVQFGIWDGLGEALTKTWETSALTLRVMGQIVIGEASLNNLSGPISIADYAGKSAAMGLTQFLTFLALMSISLGVLNLLPVPVLDGGHLMYYLWEALSGKPVTLPWTERLQKVGLAILLLLMSVAIMNDVTRLLR